MEKFDVVIIGAGPAGLKAAEVLAEGGKKVVVFERKPIVGPKVCAGGLTYKVFQLGIPISLAERIFHSIKIHSVGKTTECKSTSDKFLVATVDRGKLGQWMAEQARKQGAEIRTDSAVVEIKENYIILKDGKEVAFDYLIGADGSLSLVKNFLNLSVKDVWIAIQYSVPRLFDDLEFFFDKKLFGYGYAWIFPHKNHSFIGAGVKLNSPQAKKIRENLHYLVEKKNIDVSKSKLESLSLNCGYRGFHFGNIFLVGEAGGFTLNISGEGIYSAIVSGKEVARKILNPSYNCPKIKRLLKDKMIKEKAGKYFKFMVIKNKALTKAIFNKLI